MFEDTPRPRLWGLGGLGKTATMIRLARVFTGGGDGWQQRVAVLALHQRKPSFAALREVVVEAMEGQLGKPENWEAQLERLEDRRDRGAALAELVLGALAGRVLYVDNAESLQQDPAAGAGEFDCVPWGSDEIASFFRVLSAPTSVSRSW